MKFEIYKVLPGMCYNYRSCIVYKTFTLSL